MGIIAKKTGTNRQYLADAKKIKDNHPDKFESCEQQDREIDFIRFGFSFFPGGNTTDEIQAGLIGAIVRFTPELEKKFDAGDFIE